MQWFVFRVISLSVSLWEEFDKVFVYRVDSQCIRALSWLSTLRPYYIVLRDVASLFYTEKRWDATSRDCQKYGLTTSGDVIWSLVMLCLANSMLAALILWCLFTMYSRYCRRRGSFLVICCNSDIYSIRCTDVFSCRYSNQRSKRVGSSCRFWIPLKNFACFACYLCMLEASVVVAVVDIIILKERKKKKNVELGIGGIWTSWFARMDCMSTMVDWGVWTCARLHAADLMKLCIMTVDTTLIQYLSTQHVWWQ